MDNSKALEAAAKAASDVVANMGYPAGMGCPPNPEHALAIARAAIEAYERASWVPIAECPEEWKDGRPVLIEFVHANAQYSKDPVGEGWIAVHEAQWIDHNGGGWTWHGLCGVARRVRPLPSAPEGGE